MANLLSVVILAIACASCVFGAPQGPSPNDVQVVKYINDNNGIDNYNFA